MRILTALLSALFLSLLCACATRSVEPAFNPAGTAGTGLLVGSITYEGAKSGYRVYYRRVGSTESTFVEVGAGSVFEPGFYARQDFEALNLKGSTFAIELPAGEYEIHAWAVSSGAVHLFPTAPFSLRYGVRGQRATYAGNFNFRQTRSAGLAVTGVLVDYAQAYERDAALLIARYPQLSPALIDRDPAKAPIAGIGGPSKSRTSVYVPL